MIHPELVPVIACFCALLAWGALMVYVDHKTKDEPFHVKWFQGCMMGIFGVMFILIVTRWFTPRYDYEWRKEQMAIYLKDTEKEAQP